MPTRRKRQSGVFLSKMFKNNFTTWVNRLTLPSTWGRKDKKGEGKRLESFFVFHPGECGGVIIVSWRHIVRHRRETQKFVSWHFRRKSHEENTNFGDRTTVKHTEKAASHFPKGTTTRILR